MPEEARFSLRRLRALVVKEVLQIIRDPSSILISVVLPLILLFIYGTGLSLDLNNIRIGLILEDTSPTAQSFAETLTNTRYFQVTHAQHRHELIPLITASKLRGMVIVPSYFSAFLKDNVRPTPIQVIADGSEPNTAKFVVNYVQAVWGIWLQQQALTDDQRGLPLVGLQPRFWFNEELESRNFLLPGSMAIIMTLIGTLLTALVVSREWERGTMEALMSTPVDIRELIIGKLIPYYFLALCSMTMIVVLSILIYNLPMRGSWFALYMIAGVFLLPALSLGLLISTLARNQLISAQVAMVTGFMPAFMLSGFIFEISSMPAPIRLFTYIWPARYFVSCLQTIFLAGDDWSLFARNLGAMLVIAAVLFALTARNTVKRLD